MESKKIDTIKMQRKIAKGFEVDDDEPIPGRNISLPPEATKEVESPKVDLLREEPPATVERAKRKTTPKGDYETLFMEMKELKDRKAIYISKELHQEIAHILGTIKSGELSVGAYVENIIYHHIGVYKEDIDNLYESRFKKPSQRFNK